MKLKVWIIDGWTPENIVTDHISFCFVHAVDLENAPQQCLATIASIYWKSNEESVEGDRPIRTPISSPIESRSGPPSSSTADRVQGLFK